MLHYLIRPGDWQMIGPARTSVGVVALAYKKGFAPGTKLLHFILEPELRRKRNNPRQYRVKIDGKYSLIKNKRTL